MPREVRELLACPRCLGRLTDVVDESGATGGADGQVTPLGLACAACGVVYPIERGTAVLLADAGRPHGADPT